MKMHGNPTGGSPLNTGTQHPAPAAARRPRGDKLPFPVGLIFGFHRKEKNQKETAQVAAGK